MLRILLTNFFKFQFFSSETNTIKVKSYFYKIITHGVLNNEYKKLFLKNYIFG